MLAKLVLTYSYKYDPIHFVVALDVHGDADRIVKV